MRRRSSVSLESLTVRSQADVARELGISTMRVSQLERSALAKLRLAFVQEDEGRPKPNYQHSITKVLSQHEREAWLWKIMIVDLEVTS